jgi:hypothetical protein
MNFKNLTYKQKTKYLLIASGLFFLFVYNFVISRTFELYSINGSLHEKVMQAQNAPDKKKMLEVKINNFNNSLNKYFIDSTKNREYILATVSEFCHKNNLVLKEVPEPIITQEKDFDIETNIVVAEGGFINLLKLVYELEQNTIVARPASVNFEKKFDYKRKKDILTLSMYLQNIRMKNHESLN